MVAELQPERESLTMESVRRQRAGLHRAMVRLEDVLARPAVGRVADWGHDVAEATRGLRQAWSIHTEVTEGRDGLFEEILREAPRLANAVKRLQREHGEVCTAVDASLANLDPPPADDGSEWIEERRDELGRVLGRISRHRQRGSDLTYQAYEVEIGGES